MLTRFGQAVRKHRIDRGMRLKAMAEKLGMQMSAVSETETGRRNPSETYVERVIGVLKLADPDAAALRKAAKESQNTQRVLTANPVVEPRRAKLMAAMARKFPSMTETKADRILKILEEDDGEDDD